MKAVTWEHLAAKVVSIGLPAIGALLLVVLQQFISWSIWVTSSLEEMRGDIRQIRVATHLAIADPEMAAKTRKPAILSLMGPFNVIPETEARAGKK